MKEVVLLAGGGGHTAYALSLAQKLAGKCNLKNPENSLPIMQIG